GHLVVDGSAINGNFAQHDGGGLYNYNSSTKITNSTVDQNGAIDNTAHSNSTTGFGSGIYSNGGLTGHSDVVIDSSSVSNNGGVDPDGSAVCTAQIDGCEWVGPQYGDNGGGIWADNTTLTITGSALADELRVNHKAVHASGG